MNANSARTLFVASLCMASCLYGMFAARWELFPYPVVREAVLAASALAEVYLDRPAPGAISAVDPKLTGPTVRNYAQTAGDDLILISGGVGYLPQESATGSCLAWLMDRNGALRHVWEYDPSIWNDLERVKRAPLNTEIRPIGLHLYADGGLLVSFQGKNTWPYAVGLARYDRDSKLLWKKELLNHHWFSVADDGRIYVGGLRIAPSPVQIGATAGQIVSSDGKVSDDTLMILDADGNVQAEISMLAALVDSGWVGLFQGATDSNIGAETRDPTHLNDVRLVTAEMAQTSERLNAGDLLVSFRSLNAVGILDGATHKFKWLSAGAAIRQHSPRLYDGGVLVFDNRGGPQATGGSRLVHIDLETQLPTTLFPRADAPLPENAFYTDVAGHIDISPAHTALAALSEAGDVWEIDLRSGAVLWRYTFVDAESRLRRPIYTAKYVQEANFPLNRVAEPTP